MTEAWFKSQDKANAARRKKRADKKKGIKKEPAQKKERVWKTKQCAYCGYLLHETKWSRHGIYHPGMRASELKKGMEPLQGHYWWEQPRRKVPPLPRGIFNLPMSRSDFKLDPAVLDTTRNSIINLVRKQLRDGKKIPYYWREYGRHVVEDMFKKGTPVAGRRKPTDLKAPTKTDLRLYEVREDDTKC